jgi:hypothetical protein
VQQEVSIAPCTVVANVFVEHALYIKHLILPKLEPFRHPDTIAPGVIVLCVTLENFRQVRSLLREICGACKHFSYAATVVPDLVILLESQTNLAQMVHLFVKIEFKFVEQNTAVVPGGVVTSS